MRLTISSLILIVVLGLSQTVSAQLFYNRVGSLDPTLNGVGYVGVGAGIGLGTRTKQLSDGSLILIGSSNNGIGVQKISYDGTSDGGFGSSGYVNIPCGGCLPTDLVELSDGKLLIAEMVIPVGNEPHPGKMLDLEMLTAPGGMERNEAEYAKLFEGSGLQLNKVVPTASPFSVIEAVKA